MRGQEAFFVLLLLGCGAHLSAGLRRDIAKHNRDHQANVSDVAFRFMTNDLSYVGDEDGTGSWWFGGGGGNDEETEIVAGHTCRSKGKDSESFYASSFCYWLPEEKSPQSLEGVSAGISWKGGVAKTPLPLCSGKLLESAGSGKCLKCSICHNNAENEESTVTSTPFVEQVPLSENCLTESQIRSKCTAEQEDFATCAQKFYEQSCEKECIEVQKAGCGVVEGAAPDSWYGAGGVELTCKPPRPSAILKEDAGEQCSRISATQKPTYAQKVLKTGWLLKRGRDWEWENRFFVLLSGDEVRSPTLHYYTEEPTVETSFSRWNEISRQDKKVVLWDADRVSMKSAASYNFVGVASCFKIYHTNGRHYRLCLQGKDDDTTAGDQWKLMQKTAAERDEWVKLLQELIVRPASSR